MSLQWLEITPGISWLKATASPLSADILLIQGQKNLWLFDVGASPEALTMLQSLPQKPNVILSHFHPDHISNLDKLDHHELFLGGYTFEKIGTGYVIREPFLIDDGVKLRLFPIPSSHAKGCIGLEVNETYALLGDAAYCSAKNGSAVYNSTLLKDEIATLKALSAPYFLLSHGDPLFQQKKDVLDMLESIYAQRDPKCPVIYLK